jgi:hypothetical protein
MGRWAQRSRGGGGLNPPNFILSASIIDDATVEVTYQHPITAGVFSSFNFELLPIAAFQNAISQVSANVISLDYGSGATGQDQIRYAGTAANVLSPQTVDFP